MNQSYFFVFAMLMAATLMGGSYLHDQREALLMTEQRQSAQRCPAGELIEAPQMIIGQSEVVHLGTDRKVVFDAKIDSGAKTSSIHAKNIETFNRRIIENGEKKDIMFVRFHTEDDEGKKHVLERMVSRVHQVKSASGISTRYYFHETVWINKRSYELEINLADRSHLTKKMLLGKNLLDQGYLIDTTKSYLISEGLVLNR